MASERPPRKLTAAELAAIADYIAAGPSDAAFMRLQRDLFLRRPLPADQLLAAHTTA